MDTYELPPGPLTIAELRERVTPADIRKSYEGIWRGVYRRIDQPDDFEMRCRALALLNPQGVLTGRSAARMWGDDSASEWANAEIWLPRGRTSGSGRRYRTGSMPNAAVTEKDGLRVTTLPRTAVDLGRELPAEALVVALERLAKHNPDLPELLSTFLEHPSGEGTVPAVAAKRLREAIEMMDHRCLTLAESIARIGLAGSGLDGFQTGYPVRPGGLDRRLALADPVSGIAIEAVNAEAMADELVHEDEDLRKLRKAGWAVVVASGPSPAAIERGAPVTWHHQYGFGRADRASGANGRLSPVVATLDCLFNEVSVMAADYFGLAPSIGSLHSYGDLWETGPGPVGVGTWGGPY